MVYEIGQSRSFHMPYFFQETYDSPFYGRGISGIYTSEITISGIMYMMSFSTPFFNKVFMSDEYIL